VYVLLSESMQNSDIISFVEQLFNENVVNYQFSPRVFDNSIMWLQSRTV